jgi:ArsR family transcriptional regulator
MAHHTTATVKSRSGKTASLHASPVKVPDAMIERLAGVFRLLADKSRLKIVLALAQDGEMHVTALCDLLGKPGHPQSQPAVSHHLTLMRMLGLVGFRRDGKHNYYYLASDHVRDLFEQFFTDSGNGHKQILFEDFALAYKRR